MITSDFRFELRKTWYWGKTRRIFPIKLPVMKIIKKNIEIRKRTSLDYLYSVRQFLTFCKGAVDKIKRATRLADWDDLARSINCDLSKFWSEDQHRFIKLTEKAKVKSNFQHYVLWLNKNLKWRLENNLLCLPCQFDANSSSSLGFGVARPDVNQYFVLMGLQWVPTTSEGGYNKNNFQFLVSSIV